MPILRGLYSPKDGEGGSFVSPPILPLWLSMFMKEAAARFFFSGVLEISLTAFLAELLLLELLTD